MEREEAIRQIENRWDIMDYRESEALGEALDMAIEALQDRPTKAVPPSLADVVSVSASSLAGGIIGACILGKISVAALKKIFAAVMVVSGIVMLIWG